MFENKKVIVLGERDGVAGPAIAACVKSAGGHVEYTSTECFVWTASGAMDLNSQEVIKRLADEHGADNLVVILGAPDDESAEIAAETVVLGDPTYAGALAETQLGLSVYHVLEEDVRVLVDEDVWEEQIGVMADVLEAAVISAAVKGMREQKP